jgi:hypothetical protein
MTSRSCDPAAALLSANRNQTVAATAITAGDGLSAAYPDRQANNGASKAILASSPPPAPQGGTPNATPSNAWEKVSRTS